MRDVFDPSMPPALAVPFAQLENAFSRLRELVQDMGAEELRYTGSDGGANSTATLLAHLAHADLGYLHLVKGEPVPPDLGARFAEGANTDTVLVPSSGRSVGQLLAAHAEVIGMCRDYLRTCDDAAAVREVAVPWWPEPGTVRWVLWVMTYHSARHQGQIARLREAWKARGDAG